LEERAPADPVYVRRRRLVTIVYRAGLAWWRPPAAGVEEGRGGGGL
jgi:hypothetical protein